GGFTDVPISLLKSITEGGYNHLVAIATSGGLNSPAAHVLVQYQPQPAGNQPPVLATIANQNLVAGQTISITLSASDPNANAVTFSATGLPSYASITNHGNGTAT